MSLQTLLKSFHSFEIKMETTGAKTGKQVMNSINRESNIPVSVLSVRHTWVPKLQSKVSTYCMLIWTRPYGEFLTPVIHWILTTLGSGPVWSLFLSWARHSKMVNLFKVTKWLVIINSRCLRVWRIKHFVPTGYERGWQLQKVPKELMQIVS